MDTEETQVKESIETTPFTNWQAVGIGVKIGLVIMFFYFIYLLISALDYPRFSFQYFVLYVMLTPVAMLWHVMGFGIIGALTGKRWKKTRRAAWVGALIFALPLTAITFSNINFCFGMC